MARRTRSIVAIVFALIVVGCVGVAVGAWAGYRAARFELIDFALDVDANGIDRYISTLEHIRADEPDQAAEVLEEWLDRVLIVTMASHEPLPVTGRTGNLLTAAFERARSYRTEYPRTTGTTEMVANMFAQGAPIICVPRGWLAWIGCGGS